VRIFLDTNVLVSAIGTRGICADILRVTLAEHRLIVGEVVLAELGPLLQRKFQVTPELAKETEEFLRREGEVVGQAPALGIAVRDESDVAVPEQAVAGAADVLVTGDQDLLAIAATVSLRILSPRGFWELLRSHAAEEE